MGSASSTPGVEIAAPRKFTAKSLDLTTTHTMVISDWQPNVVYRFRVSSSDASGNTSESKDFVVKTPQKKVSIIDVIVGNFSSTFGWAKKLGM